jgi:hypothetical protein
MYEHHFPLLVQRAVTEFNIDSEAAESLVHELFLASLRHRTSNVPSWLNGALTVAMREVNGG